MDALALFPVAHRQTRTVQSRGSLLLMIFSDSTPGTTHARSGILPFGVFPQMARSSWIAGGMEGRCDGRSWRKLELLPQRHVMLENPPPMGVVIGLSNPNPVRRWIESALWECIRHICKTLRARKILPLNLYPGRIHNAHAALVPRGRCVSGISVTLCVIKVS